MTVRPPPILFPTMLYTDLFPQSDLTGFIIASAFTDHTFIQQIFFELLLCPMHCSSLWGHVSVNKTKRKSCSHGTLLLVEGETQETNLVNYISKEHGKCYGKK